MTGIETVSTIDAFLKSPTHKPIFVIGDYICDIYVIGKSKGISPEAPVPVVIHQDSYYRHGGAANVVLNLHELNAKVLYCSVLGCGDGEYEKANQVKMDFRRMGIDFQRCYSKEISVPVKTRILCDNQQIVRYDKETPGEIEPETAEKLFKEKIKDIADQYSVIVISDYMKGSVTKELAQTVIQYAKQFDIPVIVDTKRDRSTGILDFYKGAYCITPNLKEFERIMNCKVFDVDEMKPYLERFKSEFELEMAVATLSENGIALLRDSDYIRLPAKSKVEVFDVTGAGDSSLAAIAISVANRFSLEDTAKMANACGEISVGHMGTYQVSIDDLRIYFSSGVDSLNRTGVINTINRLRDSKKIVFTNGCFDLLHEGHLNLLKEAKTQGDILVVGINSDVSVKRNKGETRPILSQTERAALLSALEVVDYVVIFDEDTPYELIKELKPDVLVKGSDWSGNVVGSDIVETVHIVEHKKKISTSGIIDRIENIIGVENGDKHSSSS